jgi:glutamate-1-semialdehyde 2,1-aminomutase
MRNPQLKNSEQHTQNGYELFQYATTIIPGGSQLFGKRADLSLPGLWPSYYKEAKGCAVIAIDGKTYFDFTMVGTGTSVLGYSNPEVNMAVKSAVDRGTICTLNNIAEIELAEKLLELHPKMGMVRYARSGGEILSIAIRTARAHTGKERIAFCGYHGWHDWYLSANLENPQNLDNHLLPNLVPRGVPHATLGLTSPFEFNSIESLKKTLNKHPQEFAAVVLEPFRDNGPKANYLDEVRALCDEHNILLIFDEVTSGFRETLGGMYVRETVKPDLVTFGKAMSNGVPMAALVGRETVMQSFTTTFVSSTYWGDLTGPTAALAAIKFMEENDTGREIRNIGEKLKNALHYAANEAGLKIKITGMPSLLSYQLKVPDWPMALTYIIQEMLARGYLASDRVYANLAHTDNLIHGFKNSMCDVFKDLSSHVDENCLENKLLHSVKDMGFNKNLR